jgi:hypothetical protein
MNIQERVDALGGGVTYREAMAMPWLSRLLLHYHGLYRLRAWVSAGRPIPEPTALTYCGDDEIGAVVRAALTRMPPPVQWAVVSGCVVCGVGRTANGWTSLAPSAPHGALFEAVRLIVVADRWDHDDEALAALVAHEAAHCWYAPLAGPGLPSYPMAEATLVRTAVAWQLDEFMVGERCREELRVAALAHAWGFRGGAADPARCAQAKEQRLRALISETKQGTKHEEITSN